ncbi:MAG: Hpt domain-containing protein [Thiobacillus sp.]|nr:Hpt domain-containing protein [Thiobacillus sp.]
MNMQLDDFDIGPLTWVKPELDNALLAALEALGGWNGEDTNPLKAAAAHLHQVYGALQIVDLRGVSLLTAATEQLLEEMTKQPPLRTQASLDAALAGIDGIKGYLDGLMAGAPPAEIKLTPVYRAVVSQRGGDAPPPSELFFPNTDARPPKRAAEPLLDDTARASTLRAVRASYQRGLLQLLQNKDPLAGLNAMELAVRKVEELAPGATQYGFWWSAVGLIDAMRREAVPADIWLKRLCGRIDLQMRRLMEGSRQLAERLFNDVLYYVAQDPVPSGRTAEVNDLYQLRRYFPSISSGLPEEMLPFIASLKDNLNSAKDHWIRYCGGRADSLEAFQDSATGLFEAAVRLPNQAMKDLTRIVQAVAKRMPGVGDASHNEALQVEMATALLLGLNAADHFESLGEEFKLQAEAQAMRVQAAIDPTFKTENIPHVDLLDEFSKAAQEKLLLAQVNHEIQANLHLVEEILDKFFRNEQERGALPKVPVLLKQIQGALNILQLDVASALVAEAITRIGHFDEMDVQVPPANLNWVAEALSTLGLYVDALRYGRNDPAEMKRLLATPEAKPQPKELSVEAQARAETQRLAEAVNQWLAVGGSEAAKSQLKADLAALMRDAELVGDGNLRDQAESLRQALEGTAEQAGAAAAAMAKAKVAPSAEIQRLAQASSDVVDRELMETYIEEANEVLSTIAVQVSRLHVSPYDHEAFAVVRRGFHTLKGSGRMVGLTDLAEPAWEVEQTLNLWLRDERTPTPGLLAFLEEAGNAFQVWVMELEEQGQAQVESGHLVEHARLLRGEGVPQAPDIEADPPPKPDAGAPADSSAAAGEREIPRSEAMVEQDVDLDGHVLPAELFEIYTEEAAQRLQDMAIALAEMSRAPRPAPWEAFIRGAHTLAGISRTTGLTPLAEAAHAVEIWSGGWPDKTRVLPPEVVAGLENVLNELSGAYEQVRARHFPSSLAHVEQMLAELQAPAAVRSTQTGPAAEEAPVEVPVAPSPMPVPDMPEVSSVRDELDEQLLPVFLEEAEELLPRIGEALRHWRAQPDDEGLADDLKRVLHTLKGSARMAGVMSLGERVHGMETQVMEQSGDGPLDGLLDSLEEVFDQVYDMVERLKSGLEAWTAEAVPVPRGSGDADVPGPLSREVEPEETESAGEEAAIQVSPPLPAPEPPPPLRDEIEAQLLPIFLEEADELLPRIGEALRHWRAQPVGGAAGDDLKRVLHTLKGSARMAGAMRLGEQVHGMESRVMEHADGIATSTYLDGLEGEYDQIYDMVEHLRGGPQLPESGEPLVHHAWQAEARAMTPEAIAAQEAEMAREVRAVLDHMPPVSTAAKAPVAEELPPARDEIDEQLLPVFLEEADELLPRIGEALRDWRAQPDSAGAGDALKRVLHTLKGSARMAGAMTLGEKIHGMETQVLGASGGTVEAALLDHLEGAYDQIHDVVEGLRTGTAVTPAVSTAPQAEAQRAAPVPTPAAQPAPAAAKASLEEDLRLRQALRLKSDVLDTLLNEAGEVAIARARIENVLKGYRQTAQELAANVERLRAQLRELEIQAETQMHSRLSQMEANQFDPLEFDRFSRLQELTRQLAESVNDVSTAQDNLLAGLNEADTALIQQGRMARTLQQELMHMRMVPLNTLGERLYRIVRQSAKETGRRAQLELEGGQTELDRVVLDKIAAPLEHLVRNAVAHGVEPPSVRAAAGKQDYGEIRLAARQEGNEIVLTLSDDGGGVNAEAVRARAVEHGWLAQDQAITPDQVEAFLFRSGFSTAQVVTELAGRGVGLDVVKNEIAGIGGRVRMESTPGQGTRFTIRLPLTLALTQVVLAGAGDQTWALPANLVTMVKEVKADEVHRLHERGYLELDAELYPLRTLAELVERKPQPGEGKTRTVLLLKAGESRLALRIDALEGNLEAVVKPIGPQLARISGISGATVLGDGRVALILNPFLLAERAPQLTVEEEEAEGEQGPLVMVVDDSLTVRKITSRLLLREGYRVITAKDGVEAMELLEHELPAVMLLDIEMPRMDGFEVTQSVRGNPRLAGLPIIMITSRTAEKHRAHAQELGVNTYLGKPFQEDELLAEIASLAGSGVMSEA